MRKKDFLKRRRWLMQLSWKPCCLTEKHLIGIQSKVSKISIVSDLSTWQKSLDLVVNLKISADSTFLFWAIESKRKRRIDIISRKGHFRRRKSEQSHFFCKKLNVKSFNFQKLAKIWGKRAFLEYWRSIRRVQKIHFRSL